MTLPQLVSAQAGQRTRRVSVGLRQCDTSAAVTMIMPNRVRGALALGRARTVIFATDLSPVERRGPRRRCKRGPELGAFA